MTLKVLMIERY